MHILVLWCIIKDTMNELSYTETRQQLIEAAQQAGYHLSSVQLARWHRAGLIPYPKHRSLGKGHGTQTLYPTGATRQLLSLCAIHQQERRLPYVAWGLWLAGYPVRFALVRRFLTDCAADREATLKRLRDHPPEPQEFAKHRLKGRIARIRRRIGRDRFPMLIEVMQQVAVGRFEGFETKEVSELIIKGAGVQRATNNPIKSLPPLLDKDMTEPLQEVSRILAEQRWRSMADTLSEAELCRARDEVKLLFTAIISVGKVTPEMYGRDLFGFTGISELLGELTAVDQAMAVLFWPVVRSRFSEGAEKLLAIARSWLEIALPAIATLQKLAAEVPDIADLLTPKKMRRLLANPRAQRRHFQELCQFYQQHKAELDAFWEKRPELRLAVQSTPETMPPVIPVACPSGS